MNNQVSADVVQKALGEPVGLEFAENASKVRRNLLVVSFISILLVLSGAVLSKESAVLGLRFDNIPDATMRYGMLLATVYLCAHFLWYVFDSFLEWRARITGTRLAFVTGAMWASEHADHPSDPRQSTLYRWWREQAPSIGDLGRRAAEIERSMVKWEAAYLDLAQNANPASNLAHAIGAIGETREQVRQLMRAVEKAVEVLSAPRIPVSLKRFDAWFELLLRSQNLRWLVIEALVPLLVGGYALLLLITDVSHRY